jgi:hypothetical protein
LGGVVYHWWCCGGGEVDGAVGAGEELVAVGGSPLVVAGGEALVGPAEVGFGAVVVSAQAGEVGGGGLAAFVVGDAVVEVAVVGFDVAVGEGAGLVDEAGTAAGSGDRLGQAA